MKLFYIFFSLLITAGTVTAGSPVEDPQVEDPSAAPLQRKDGTFGERFRLTGDINNDGYEDLLLSDDIANLGQSGIRYFIYLKNEEGKFTLYDSIYTGIGSVAVEHFHEDSRLWLFVRLDSQSGIISYCDLGDDAITGCRSMRIHQGDGGTAIGGGVFRAVFGNSDVSFTLQKSETIDGKVTWKDF